jgi:tetratricopeptide (TPR) repeat protein
LTNESNSSGSRSYYRIGIAAAGLLAATPLVYFAICTGIAAWLVFPAPLLNPPPPFDDLSRLRAAADLAPGDAMYSYYLGQVQQVEMRRDWMSDTASERGRAAAQAAEKAAYLLPPNPYFHRLVGSVALDRSLHPETPSTEVPALVEQSVLEMGRALVRSPYSPLLHEQVGLELLRAWDVLGRDGHELAATALRRAAELQPEQLAGTLQNIWARLEPSIADQVSEAATPEGAVERLTLARFLEGRAQLQVETGGSGAGQLGSRALEEYGRALVLSDLDLEYVEAWAAAHRRLSSAEEGVFLTAAEELIRDNPDRPEAWLALAEARAFSGDPEGELQALRRGVEMAEGSEGPILHAVLRRQADRLFEQGRYEPALEAYERLATSTPRDPFPIIQSAHCLDALDREDEALELFERAVRVAPQDTSVREALATAYIARHEYLEAIEQWQAILARDPRAVGPRIRIARAYVTLGILDRASRYYAEALELDPDNATLRREMDEVVRRLGGLQ